MANILYRGATVPTATNTAGVKNAALTNLEIDQNFYGLDSAKFEKSGGTVSGDTTFSTNVTVSGNLTVNGNLYAQSNAAAGTVTRVEYNIPHPFLLMGAT